MDQYGNFPEEEYYWGKKPRGAYAQYDTEFCSISGKNGYDIWRCSACKTTIYCLPCSVTSVVCHSSGALSQIINPLFEEHHCPPWVKDGFPADRPPDMVG